MSVRYGFDGQVAVITGAANGFGLAVASRLADEGARLVLVDRDAAALEAAAAKLGGLAVVADVSVESEVDGYVAAAVAEFGRIDLFFNNAGIEGRMAPDDGAVGGGLRPGLGGQRARRVHGAAGRPCGDEAAAVRGDREHRVDGGDQGRGHVLAVHRVQARGARADQVGRPGGGAVRDPGQLRRARAHRHPDGAGPDRADRPVRSGGRVRVGLLVGAAVPALRDGGRGGERGAVAAVVGVGVRVGGAAPDRRRAQRR